MLTSAKRRVIALALAGVACVLAGGCATAAPRPKGVVAPEARWEEVSRAGRVFGEGVVAAKDGRIYVSDITISTVITENNPGGTIYRYDPATGATGAYLTPSGMSNGLHVDRQGDLIIAQGADTGGGRAVVRRDLETGAQKVIADRYEGKRLNSPNDVTSDAQGRIYFTDARYIGVESMELPNAVYRVDPDGRITQLTADIFRPNGIEVSPDGRRLYVAAFNENGRLPINPNGPARDRFELPFGGVVVYDLDAQGAVSNGRVFFRNDQMGVDGMAIDTDGNLYLAMHDGNREMPFRGIAVLTPAGEVLERLPLPERGLTTNLAFGRGSDDSSLYLSTAAPWRLWRIKTLRRGYFP
jgi:gluconolactonase